MENENKDFKERTLRSLKQGLGRLWRRRSVTITEYDPTYKVVYLGNVLTGWAKGDGCVEKPLCTLWKNYTSSTKPNVHMKVTVTQSGLKAVTKEHGLTEYWSHRVTYCAAPAEFPKIFCWVYRHEGRKLKQELRCHAVLCSKESIPRRMVTQLNSRLLQALNEFKRDKLSRQNARLSLANSVYENPSLPRRKILLSTGPHNYRPPLERSKSAPKLMSIEESLEEEDENTPCDIRKSIRKAKSTNECVVKKLIKFNSNNNFYENKHIDFNLLFKEANNTKGTDVAKEESAAKSSTKKGDQHEEKMNVESTSRIESRCDKRTCENEIKGFGDVEESDETPMIYDDGEDETVEVNPFGSEDMRNRVMCGSLQSLQSSFTEGDDFTTDGEFEEEDEFEEQLENCVASEDDLPSKVARMDNNLRYEGDFVSGGINDVSCNKISGPVGDKRAQEHIPNGIIPKENAVNDVRWERNETSSSLRESKTKGNTFNNVVPQSAGNGLILPWSNENKSLQENDGYADEIIDNYEVLSESRTNSLVRNRRKMFENDIKNDPGTCNEKLIKDLKTGCLVQNRRRLFEGNNMRDSGMEDDTTGSNVKLIEELTEQGVISSLVRLNSLRIDKPYTELEEDSTPSLQSISSGSDTSTTRTAAEKQCTNSTKTNYDLDSLSEEDSDESGYVESVPQEGTDDKERDLPHHQLVKNCVLTPKTHCLQV